MKIKIPRCLNCGKITVMKLSGSFMCRKCAKKWNKKYKVLLQCPKCNLTLDYWRFDKYYCKRCNKIYIFIRGVLKG